jgi:hypothetical protein
MSAAAATAAATATATATRRQQGHRGDGRNTRLLLQSESSHLQLVSHQMGQDGSVHRLKHSKVWKRVGQGKQRSMSPIKGRGMFTIRSSEVGSAPAELEADVPVVEPRYPSAMTACALPAAFGLPPGERPVLPGPSWALGGRGEVSLANCFACVVRSIAIIHLQESSTSSLLDLLVALPAPASCASQQDLPWQV